MSRECNWIESRLSDLFSSDPDDRQRVDAHLASCPSCREEYRGNQEVDRLLAAHFDSRMARAQAPSARPARRLLAMAAAAAAIALLVWVGTTSSRFPSPTEAPTAMGGDVGIDEAEDPGPILAKPTDEPSAPMPSAAADGVSAPPDELSFYVVDAAGYAYTLSDLSGSVVVLGVFGQSGPSRQDIVRLYDAMPVDDELRFIAVGLDETVPESVQGVPFMVNRGSTLVGTPAGEFAILTRDGSVYQRGSLSDARLEEVILTGLAELNVARGESEP